MHNSVTKFKTTIFNKERVHWCACHITYTVRCLLNCIVHLYFCQLKWSGRMGPFPQSIFHNLILSSDIDSDIELALHEGRVTTWILIHIFLFFSDVSLLTYFLYHTHYHFHVNNYLIYYYYYYYLYVICNKAWLKWS